MQVKHKRICAVYGEGADGTCQKWLANFPAGDFSLDDTLVVILVEVDNSQIKTSVENNQCYTT